MPWEKSFNEVDAVEKAMQVFWKKGYDATSITDLIKGTGINRGSLYNAFGGKHEIFVAALVKYDAEKRRAALAELEALDNPVAAINGLFDSIVQETTSDIEKKGCFLINTALSFDSQDVKIQAIVTKAINEFDAFFRRCIEVAQARQEISATLDPSATAKALLSFVVAIRVLGRGVFDEAALKQVSAQARLLIS